MKPIIHDDKADMQMVGAVVAIFVTLIISVLVFYNIAASIDTSNADGNVAENVYGFTPGPNNGDETGNNEEWENYNQSTVATNGTDDTLAQAATFFQIAPIIGIVVVAVVILGYVGKIGV